MGEIEGTYRALPTSGTRLGGQTPVGVSTLEPEQTLSPGMQEKQLHVRVKLLDSTVEVFDIENVEAMESARFLSDADAFSRVSSTHSHPPGMYEDLRLGVASCELKTAVHIADDLSVNLE